MVRPPAPSSIPSLHLCLEYSSQQQSNFLPLPTKRATPILDLGPKLLSYITNNFRDAHPEAFKRDVEQFVALRREWVEGKGEAHPEGVKGLMRWVSI